MDDAACAAALVLVFAGESSLRTASSELVRLAREMEHAAAAANVSCMGIAAVIKMFDTDDMRKMESLNMLEETAVALEKGAADIAASSPRHITERDQDGAQATSRLDRALDTLTCTAQQLAQACQSYRRVAEAIPLVRRAAEDAERARHAAAEAERAESERARLAAAEAKREESERARETAAQGRWWSCFGRRRPRGRTDIEALQPLLIPPPTPSPSATTDLAAHGQGDEKRSGMIGYGLFGSIGLIPYLGPEKVAKKVELLSKNERLFLHACICLWWTLVAVGAPCSAYAQSLFERVYALLSARLGIMGMNILVILFMYWVLDNEHEWALWALYCLLGVACFSHVAFLIAACWRRHF